MPARRERAVADPDGPGKEPEGFAESIYQRIDTYPRWVYYLS